MAKVVPIVMLLLSMFFVCGQNSKAEAYDVYVGTYDSGLKAYVMSETLHFYNNYRSYDITVKAVGYITVYVDYHIWSNGPGEPFQYKNSQGYSGYIQNGSVEEKINNYAFNEWGKIVTGNR